MKPEIMSVRGNGHVGARFKLPGFGRRGAPLYLFVWAHKGGEPEFSMGGFVCGDKGHATLMKALVRAREWAAEIVRDGYDAWAKKQRTRDAIKGKFGEVPRSPVGEIGEAVPGGNGVWSDRRRRKK